MGLGLDFAQTFGLFKYMSSVAQANSTGVPWYDAALDMDMLFH